MKRPCSSDSLGALMSACQPSEEKSPGNNRVYNRGFQSMLEGLDEEDCIEESSQIAEKKRRLSVDQVKALEKNFEVENKLEPERKVKLAQELGLQPRQVAVWFQNRRARWKTKQLERDYGLLKKDYETLKLNYEVLQHDKEALLAELRDLKSKLQEEKTGSNLSVKEEIVKSEPAENQVIEHGEIRENAVGWLETTEPNHDFYHSSNGVGASVFGDVKDGSSDSDSSAILNEDNSPNAAISSSGVFQKHQLFMSPTSSLRFSCSSASSPPSVNCLQFSDARALGRSSSSACMSALPGSLFLVSPAKKISFNLRPTLLVLRHHFSIVSIMSLKFFPVKPISSITPMNPLRSATQHRYVYPDPIPEFAEAETQKFKNELTKKLLKNKQTFGDDLDAVVEVCEKIFNDFLHKEYGGPGTLLVEPFTDMLVALKEKKLPGAPVAARAALLWAQNHVDQDWEVWTSQR